MTTTFCTGMCYQAPGTCNCGLRPVVPLYVDDCGCQTIRSHRAGGSGKIDGDAPAMQLVAQGWICAGCGQGWAPHVDRCANCGPHVSRCECQKRVVIFDGNTTRPQWGTFTTELD